LHVSLVCDFFLLSVSFVGNNFKQFIKTFTVYKHKEGSKLSTCAEYINIYWISCIVVPSQGLKGDRIREGITEIKRLSIAPQSKS